MKLFSPGRQKVVGNSLLKKGQVFTLIQLLFFSLLAVPAICAPNDYYVTNGGQSFKPYVNNIFTPNNFSFEGFTEGAGTYRIIVRPVSSAAELIAEDFHTHDRIQVNPCPDYGLPMNSYKSACYTVYATEDQILEFTFSDPQYSTGEAILTQDYFPDNPNNIVEQDWLQWAYWRNFAPAYASAFYGFKASINAVGQNTANRIQNLQALDAILGVATAGVNANEVIRSQYTDPNTGAEIIQYGVNWSRTKEISKIDDIVPCLNVAQKGMTAAYGSYSESNDMWLNNLSYVADAASAAASLARGDMYSAWQTIAMDFAQAGVYGYGVYDTWEIDKGVNAYLIINEILVEQIFDGGLQRELTDNELRVKIDVIADLSDESCGLWDDWVGACGWDRYDEDYVLAMYHDVWAQLQNWISERKTMPNLYVDVDMDGVLNVDEIQLGYNPNDPHDIPLPPPLSDDDKRPVAVLSLDSYEVSINSTITADASSSSDTDGDISSYQWQITRPDGSSDNFENSMATASFTLNQEGDYTIRLKVYDGVNWSLPAFKTVTVTKSHTNIVEIYEDDILHVYIENTSLGKCDYEYLNTFTVPAGEQWTKIDFWASQGDIILLVDDDEIPTVSEDRCSSGYMNEFDSDEEYDWYDGTAHFTWTKDLNPGDKLYIAAYSYAGVSNHSFNVPVTVNKDLDNDGVPDSEEDPQCRNNSLETFDNDNDGICNNGDAFPNDPAASLDTDGDGYPDSWNSGQSAADSTTGLLLDLFVHDSSEWADTDGDNTGDNADKFPTDPAASSDMDNDGYPGSWNIGKNESDSTTGLSLDKFPSDPAAALDSDGDGYPDSWNQGMDQIDSTTGLSLDYFPFDRDEWIDSDGDGVGDNSDWAPYDYLEWADSDGDGVGDNADVAPTDPNRTTNIAPTLATIADQAIETGESVSLALNYSDGDSDPLEIVLISSPTFMSLSAGNLFLSPTIDDIGYYEVTVRVSDNYGGVAAQRFSVTVTQGCVSTNYYLDSDGDGFGDPNVEMQACSQPQGYVLNDLDCNDGNFDIHPDAQEICDNLDNNCNGSIDENSGAFYYLDLDGDGFGDLNIEMQACGQPQGYVMNSLDCNDNSPDINPSAEEVCDKVDNNCDEQIDENNVCLSESDFPWNLFLPAILNQNTPRN